MSGSDLFYLMSMLVFLGMFVLAGFLVYKWGGKPYEDERER